MTTRATTDAHGRKVRGQITYDHYHGHVCTCTEVAQWDEDGLEQHVSYLPTVSVDRTIEPTETGSWFYVCSRCGAGAWSGC